MADMKRPEAESVWKEYQKGLSFNTQQGLYATVRTNENFFIGRQWEGVEAGGLPTPVFNFLKRVVLFTVAGITSTNLKLQAAPLGNSEEGGRTGFITGVVNREFDALFEQNRITNLLREYLRNAAVDGDGCMYTYWDPDIDTGHPVTGAVVTEIIENTRVFFGNTGSRRVQKQPYIIINKKQGAVTPPQKKRCMLHLPRYFSLKIASILLTILLLSRTRNSSFSTVNILTKSISIHAINTAMITITAYNGSHCE